MYKEDGFHIEVASYRPPYTAYIPEGVIHFIEIIRYSKYSLAKCI